MTSIARRSSIFAVPYGDVKESLDVYQEINIRVQSLEELEPRILDVSSRKKAIPKSLKITYYGFFSVSIFLFSQFVLTFFGAAAIEGFTGLVGGVMTFGLFRVFRKIAEENF